MKNETIYLCYSRYKKIETIFMIDETKQHITSRIMQFPSIFIPRVSCHNNEAYIESIFWQYFGGTETPILRIDLIVKEDARNGQIYQIAFVHFKEVAETESIKSLASQLENGESVKFVHSYPWFWILRKNTSKPKVRDMPHVVLKKDEAEIIKTQEELKANKPPRVRQEAWDQFIYAMAEYEEGATKAEAEQVHGLPLKEELKEKKQLPRRHFGGGDAEYESYGEPMDPVYGTWW